ncbi:hypothetical protein RhiLY_13258 [Ceratobasidium sp. AG-Ba]|nr:hypothetical protein RhiLY_13258 [Ceratobasidium sp. AG-Ba]
MTGKGRSDPSRRRHNPEKAEGVLVSAVGSRIPRKIDKIFEDGWKEHVPLSMLTDSYCESREAAADPDKMSWTMKHGRVALASSSLSTVKSELDLNFAEWTQAWRRLLILIKRYFRKSYLNRWRAHFNHIFSNPNRDRYWHLFLQYDSSMRERSTQESIDASVFQQHIFDHFVLEHQLQPSAPQPLSMPQGGHPLPTPSTRRAEPPLLYNSTDRPGPRNSYTNPRHKGDKKFFRCFRCGRAEPHGPSTCRHTSQSNGREIIITKPVAGGPWMLDGGPLCYKFNTASGCPKPDCDFKPHRCSLCKSSVHGAQQCTA